ncbi:hypothetical protein D3C72_1792970 [compost metagenome]
MHWRSIITILLGLVAATKNNKWHTVTKLIRISSRFQHGVPTGSQDVGRQTRRQTSDFSDVRKEEWIFNKTAKS